MNEFLQVGSLSLNLYYSLTGSVLLFLFDEGAFVLTLAVLLEFRVNEVAACIRVFTGVSPTLRLLVKLDLPSYSLVINAAFHVVIYILDLFLGILSRAKDGSFSVDEATCA